MRGVTHLAGGILASSALAIVAGTTDARMIALGVAASCVGSLAPDWVNIAIPGLRVRGATGHRGFTHWIITALASSTCVWLVSSPLAGFWMAGMLSHIVLDALTERGVPMFGPLPWQVSLLPIKEDGTFDHILGAALVVLAAVITIKRLV
jgi:inner membrane protein